MDTSAGHYTRQLQTKAVEVSLKVPKFGSLPFETAIIERYKRRESSVDPPSTNPQQYVVIGFVEGRFQLSGKCGLQKQLIVVEHGF